MDTSKLSKDRLSKKEKRTIKSITDINQEHQDNIFQLMSLILDLFDWGSEVSDLLAGRFSSECYGLAIGDWNILIMISSYLFLICVSLTNVRNYLVGIVTTKKISTHGIHTKTANATGFIGPEKSKCCYNLLISIRLKESKIITESILRICDEIERKIKIFIGLFDDKHVFDLGLTLFNQKRTCFKESCAIYFSLNNRKITLLYYICMKNYLDLELGNFEDTMKLTKAIATKLRLLDRYDRK